MDNYLSHRWPKGPGLPPVPMPGPGQPPAGKKRRWLRPLVTVLCVVLSLGLLCAISFWSVNRLADYFESLEPDDSHSFPDRFSAHQSDWTADDLPWGTPDPAARLSVDEGGGPVLPASAVYRAVLPSLIYIEAETEEGYNTGTGVIVTRSGYALTNYHIIDESTKIRVMPLDGEKAYHNAKVIGFDEDFDIAVLKFEGDGLVPAPLGDSDTLSVGDTVYAVGNPMGYLQGSMTDGIISALGRDEEVDGNGMGYIQTSAALNPGNSGGALVNSQGQVVGVTSAKITGLVFDNEGGGIEDAAVIEGIGLALPTSDILPFVNHILATGKSCRPAMGITCAQSRQNGQAGIKVRSVDNGVPAQKAGLTVGDFIVSANGEPVPTLTDLRRVLYRTGVDGEVVCGVLRNGEELEVSFTLIDNLEKDG